MTEKEEEGIEIVEIGEGDIAVLLAALKRLNNGIYALKVTVDFLSSRIGSLQENISNLEKALREHTTRMQEEMGKFSAESREILDSMRGYAEALPKDVRLSLDLFLEKLSRDLEEARSLVNTVEGDILSLRAQVKEVQMVVADTMSSVKADVSSLRAKFSEMEAVLSELAQRVSRLEETMLATTRQLEFAIRDLSTQVAALRMKVSQGQEEQSEGT
jgi:chromosome segregation ATPase